MEKNVSQDIQKENEEYILKIENVNKKYKITNKSYFQALYSINVTFKKGELVSIIGESGSGKSTLMNLIGGLDSDFEGNIIACGKNLNTLSDKELDKYRKDNVGFVFQSFNLISHLSILDNVTLALTLSNISEKEKVRRATEMLKLVGLSSQIKKKPTQLSGGQKQRVAIARALINNPDIIIADEPTGALDTTTTLQILKILKEIADSGKLVIMVTHSEKVAAISSRVVEISDGRITSDHPNKNYDKNKLNLSEEEIEFLKSNTNEIDEEYSKDDNIIEEKSPKKTRKLKQNLSYLSAIRLSFHNMWASKIKNFLMAFGVAIGIGSLLLMLCFSSGITDYISNTMENYSNPKIATIKSRSEGNSLNTFTEEDIATLTNEINNYLAENNSDFEVDENENLYYGFEVITMTANLTATISYDLNDDGDITQDEYLNITYLYTTPPYYNEDNLWEDGEMSTADGGIMVSPAIVEFFGDIYSIGKTVTLTINVNTDISSGTQTPSSRQSPIVLYEPITAIVDTSVMSMFPVVYIDYNHLAAEYSRLTGGETLAPTTLYIQTPDSETTDLINKYIATRNDLTGSIEESLAGMFNEMMDTIGTSLIIISMISLVVSAIMILVVMYMSVTERTKEIGVLKSIGARKKDIKRIFTSESFLVGLLSGICGLIFGGILYLIVYLVLINLIGIAPLSFKWYYIFIALGVSTVISILSGLWPASKAARLDPVEALRRE